MLKVGLLGCGGMGTNHANCYGALADKVELAAVADVVYEKAKGISDKFGGRIYASGEELIRNEDVDIIDICLPTYLHANHAVMAMKKGANVLIEKPVCLNLDEAEVLLNTQKETGKKVQVGQVIRFWDEYVWLRNVVRAGTYGKLLSASFFRLSPNPKWGWENWFNDPDLSGTMATDLHIHDVDFVRYLMGCEPDEVFSRAVRNKDGVLEQIFTTYQFDDAVITSEGCWDFPDSYPFQMSFRVKLEKATIEFNDELTVYPIDGMAFNPEIQTDFDKNVDIGINISNLSGYFNEINYFVDCITYDKPILVAPLDEAVKSLELAVKELELTGGRKK